MSYQGAGKIMIASISLDDSVNHASSMAFDPAGES